MFQTVSTKPVVGQALFWNGGEGVTESQFNEIVTTGYAAGAHIKVGDSNDTLIINGQHGKFEIKAGNVLVLGDDFYTVFESVQAFDDKYDTLHNQNDV